MLLGSLLSRLQSETASAGLLEATGDLILIARVEEARADHGESAGEYASGAAGRFSRSASDEDWLALMNVIERADDPATACLRHMVEWALKADQPAPVHSGCSCGKGGGEREGEGGCHDGA